MVLNKQCRVSGRAGHRKRAGSAGEKPVSQRPVWSASGQGGHLQVTGHRPATPEKPADL